MTSETFGTRAPEECLPRTAPSLLIAIINLRGALRGDQRVFAIEIERCRGCGGKLKVIASIEDPALTERILAHYKSRAEREHEGAPFASRAPPLQPSLV